MVTSCAGDRGAAVGVPDGMAGLGGGASEGAEVEQEIGTMAKDRRMPSRIAGPMLGFLSEVCGMKCGDMRERFCLASLVFSRRYDAMPEGFMPVAVCDCVAPRR
jgi:hypothetical protein